MPTQSTSTEAGKLKNAADSLADMKRASHDLQTRISEEKRRNAMPIDAALGNPEQEAKNADGRNDLPDTDDE